MVHEDSWDEDGWHEDGHEDGVQGVQVLEGKERQPSWEDTDEVYILLKIVDVYPTPQLADIHLSQLLEEWHYHSFSSLHLHCAPLFLHRRSYQILYPHDSI